MLRDASFASDACTDDVTDNVESGSAGLLVIEFPNIVVERYQTWVSES